MKCLLKYSFMYVMCNITLYMGHYVAVFKKKKKISISDIGKTHFNPLILIVAFYVRRVTMLVH